MTFKTVVQQFVIAVVSILIGVVAFEGVLSIAIPGQRASEASHATEPAPPKQGQKTAVTKEPSLVQPKVPDLTQQSLAARSTTKSAACHSSYYAVFDTKSGPDCVRNPTNLMAHWGPPSPSWFRTLGGEFRASATDAVPSQTCTCLTAQSGYQYTAGLEPVHRIIFDGEPRHISKWVCGDPCSPTAMRIR